MTHCIDREITRFIYVRDIKKFDPFKFSFYAWCIKIAIAGSLAPVRLECQKNDLFIWKPILKKIMQVCSLMLTKNCVFVQALTMKCARKRNLFIQRPTYKFSDYLRI